MSNFKLLWLKDFWVILNVACIMIWPRDDRNQEMQCGGLNEIPSILLDIWILGWLLCLRKLKKKCGPASGSMSLEEELRAFKSHAYSFFTNPVLEAQNVSPQLLMAPHTTLPFLAPTCWSHKPPNHHLQVALVLMFYHSKREVAHMPSHSVFMDRVFQIRALTKCPLLRESCTGW